MTYRYERLTWPEAKAAAEANKVCILPVGSVEQHGPFLPLDVDTRLPEAVAEAAAQQNGNILIMPTFNYGYTGHVMDFPGTINTNYNTMIESIIDIGRSLAYHGFKNLILLNGHGSNSTPLDLAARRINLETTLTCAHSNWWKLLTIDPDSIAKWRESGPGGVNHACEMETAMYLHIDADAVKQDLIENDMGHVPDGGFAREAFSIDSLNGGAVSIIPWTSQMGSRSGTFGMAKLATPEKGRIMVEEAAMQLSRLVDHMRANPLGARVEHHGSPRPMPPAWGERPFPSNS